MALNTVSGTIDALTANGNTPWRIVVGPARVLCYDAHGGGTWKIQIQDPDGSTVDLPAGSGSAPDDNVLDWPPGVVNKVRVNLASSTTPAFKVLIQSASYR